MTSVVLNQEDARVSTETYSYSSHPRVLPNRKRYQEHYVNNVQKKPIIWDSALQTEERTMGSIDLALIHVMFNDCILLCITGEHILERECVCAFSAASKTNL
ncbi:hypothetical protein Chor_006562 [Crotalus horridus]